MIISFYNIAKDKRYASCSSAITFDCLRVPKGWSDARHCTI